MDAAERAELLAAIVGHCQWLEQQGLPVPAAPEHLGAWQLFAAPWAVPAVSQFMATAILSNLAALCAFRTREGMSRTRQALRERARQDVHEMPAISKGAGRQHQEMMRFGTDEAHIRRLVRPLLESAARVRTVQRALARHVLDLKKRHKRAAKLGFKSLSLADIALARWTQACARRFGSELDFLAGQLPGQEIVPHAGPTTGKAWHRLRAECLLQLKEAQVPRAQLRELLPPARAWSDDADRRSGQVARRAARDDKSIKRAEERRAPAAERISRPKETCKDGYLSRYCSAGSARSRPSGYQPRRAQFAGRLRRPIGTP
jgi:hypothetical protein